MLGMYRLVVLYTIVGYVRYVYIGYAVYILLGYDRYIILPVKVIFVSCIKCLNSYLVIL